MSRVIVIGGGVAGLCSAWFARKRGYAVTIIDKAIRGNCSWGNAGMIVPSHFIPLAAPGMPAAGLKMLFKPDGPFAITPRLDPDLMKWVLNFLSKSNHTHVNESVELLWRMNFESGLLYQQFQEMEEFDFGLREKGLIVYCKSSETMEHERSVARQAHTIGVDAQVLSGRELQNLDPGLRLDVLGGVYYSGDAFFDPAVFMSQLRSQLESDGVTFHDEVVKELKVVDERLLAANGHEADEFILSAGVWSSQLVGTLGISMPMQGGKGYSFTLEQPEVLPEICSILIEARIAVTPMDGKIRFAGTMQLDGLNSEISNARLQGIKKRIPKYFPEFRETDFADLDTWVGLRPCSPDGLPYVGRLQPFKNLFVATGGAMMGMSLGPWMGKTISDMISNQTPEISQLSPVRYAQRN